MKTVQIPYDLFLDIVMYHLRGEDDYEEEIRQGLEQKLDAMLNRQLYSRRSAELSLDCSSVGAVTGACHAPVAGRQGNALAAIPAPPVPIEKSAEFEMDLGKRLCAGAVCK